MISLLIDVMFSDLTFLLFVTVSTLRHNLVNLFKIIIDIEFIIHNYNLQNSPCHHNTNSDTYKNKNPLRSTL